MRILMSFCKYKVEDEIMEVDSKGFENLSRIHYKYRRYNFYNVKKYNIVDK